MKRMSRLNSKKSHSWWWDSHISPKNSRWLADNLEEMDRCVKEMLKLIEEEGDSFAKKAEMYYQKRPELVAHVEDFYRMYRALAERYDNVTGELRRNMKSELQSQGSGSGSDLGSEPPSPSLLHPPELTPERKPPRPKPGPRAAGFDVFLGSGGSSDLSRKGSDGSSSSSNSDSDSDDSKDANVDDMCSALQHRILELENELRDAMEKLHKHEEKGSHYEHFENGDHSNCNSRISSLEKELIATGEKLSVAEADISSLRENLVEKTVFSEDDSYVDHVKCSSRISALEKELIVTGEKLSVAEADLLSLRLEKTQLPELEELVGVLESEISHYKREIDDLKGAMTAASQQFEAEISHRDRAIEECKTEIYSLSEVYSQEKISLEALVTNLEGAIEKLQKEIKTISQEKLLLEAKLTEKDHMIRELDNNAASAAERFLLEKCALEAQVGCLSQPFASLEAKVISLENEVEQLEAEKKALRSENDKNIEELNKNLDGLKLKTDMLTANKEELLAKVSKLIIDVKFRDEQISQMNDHLHQLHLEHAKLITEIEEARRTGSDLRSRVKELEDEVDMQRMAILDGAEGKREAIRQLCFSLEHYRNGYYQLRQVLQGHKRPAVMAT